MSLFDVLGKTYDASTTASGATLSVPDLLWLQDRAYR